MSRGVSPDGMNLIRAQSSSRQWPVLIVHRYLLRYLPSNDAQPGCS